jgi:hypothetical protein
MGEALHCRTSAGFEEAVGKESNNISSRKILYDLIRVDRSKAESSDEVVVSLV